jgi:hypothetical protein
MKTLKQITGDRLRCQYCKMPLRPQTLLLELPGHLDGPPDAEELGNFTPISNSFWTPSERSNTATLRSWCFA